MNNNLGNRNTMANNIKRYMLIKGVNAIEICRALKIAPATFSDWTHGRTYPRIDRIEMMANYFGVTKADLVEEPILNMNLNSTAQELLRNYQDASPEIQKAAFNMLKDSAEGNRKREKPAESSRSTG